MARADRLKGIVLMVAALAVFAVLDALAKAVIQDLPTPVAVAFRYFAGLVFSLVVVWRAGGPALLTTTHPVLQASRGLLLLGSTGLNFGALNYLQLAQTSSIAFTIPLWVCALSAPLLGERVGLRRWAGVAVGFLGVLVVMRPGSMSFHWAMLLSLASAVCAAFYNIVTRKVGGADRAETSLFYVGLFGSLGALLPLPWHWQMPVGTQWLMLLGMGLCGSLGHLMLIQAHRLAPASLLAPFAYTQIVWMILFGFLLFSNLPDLWTLLGGAMVIGAGLLVFLSERREGREPAEAVAGD
jgi:drug/metabolite transporter (DMT)-like permease